MKPFDLKAAKRGEPIQTRDGSPVEFIAHVPEADGPYQIVVKICSTVQTRHGNGLVFAESALTNWGDLFMAPRKRTVWVNLYEDKTAIYYETVISANKEQVAFMSKPRIGNRAWPLEIKE